MFLFQGCPYFRDVLISGVSLFQGCSYFRGVLISGVFLFQGCLTPEMRTSLLGTLSCPKGVQNRYHHCMGYVGCLLGIHVLTLDNHKCATVLVQC